VQNWSLNKFVDYQNYLRKKLPAMGIKKARMLLQSLSALEAIKLYTTKKVIMKRFMLEKKMFSVNLGCLKEMFACE
jgi:hypothetical protein